MNEFTEKSVFVGMMTLLSAVLATAIYLLLSSITYALLVAMPSIASLSTIATYFATIGVIGLSCALVLFAIGLIISPFAIFFVPSDNFGYSPGTRTMNWFLFITVVSLVGGILSSLGFSIPFFISILCGAPAFNTSIFLSVSAANMSFLTAGVLIVSAVALLSIMFVTKHCFDNFDRVDTKNVKLEIPRNDQPNHPGPVVPSIIVNGVCYEPLRTDNTNTIRSSNS